MEDPMEDVTQLEEDWSVFSGCQNVVACNSGTSSLHLALAALQLPQGAEILMPDLTMVACARAAVLAGLTPVFVDCKDDLLLDTSLLEGAAGPRTVAVMPVHLYGRRVNMEQVVSVARRKGWAVIEDCAEYHGGPVSQFSDAWCWSFYRNKVVAGEEGGAVAYRQPHHADAARRLRNLGFIDRRVSLLDDGPVTLHDFTHVPGGHNYRMSNAHARLASTSLAQYESNKARRRAIEGWYEVELQAAQAGYPALRPMPVRSVPWVYDLRVVGMSSGQQDVLVASLLAAGVQARHGFKPLHAQEEFKACHVAGGGRADVLSREVIYLPLTPDGSVTHSHTVKAFEVIKSAIKSW